MPKSTPGPWQVKRYANHELQTDFVMVVIGDRVHMIGYSDEDKANAHLIAAAPAMLEALENAERFIENGIEMGYISEPQPGTPESATLSAVKEAVKAAKGEV